MVAAPQYASMTITDGSTSISVDLYLSDVVNGAVNFDSGISAGATSETFYKCPINGKIIDLSILTGMTDTTCVRATINGSPTKSVIRYNSHLNTSSQRTQLNIPVAAGENIGFVQLA